MKKQNKPPIEDSIDKVLKVVPPLAGVADMVAGTGSAISAGVGFMLAFLNGPFQKRTMSWLEDIGKRLQKLECEAKINIEELKENENFIDTVLYASQIALRSSHEEKRKALRNAVLNAALPNPPEQALQQMFLNFIDEFTEWHLRILKLMDSPGKWNDENDNKLINVKITNSLISILEGAYKELVGKAEFCDIIWQDLYTKKMVIHEHLYNRNISTIVYQSRSTQFGSQFIKFIEDPLK